MDLIFFLLSGFDGIVVGILVFYLIGLLFGNNPLARLLKLLLGVGAGIAYLLLCINLGYGEADNINMGTFLFTILAPAGLVVLLLLIKYMFKNE